MTSVDRHPLDTWIDGLRRVGGHLGPARFDDQWHTRWFTPLEEWSFEDVILFRSLLRPTPEQLEDSLPGHLLAWVKEPEKAPDTASTRALSAWSASHEEILASSSYSPGDPTLAAGARYMRTGMPAGIWSWRVRRLDDDLAVVYVSGDQLSIGSLAGSPAGLVNTRQVVEGVTFLLAEIAAGFQIDREDAIGYDAGLPDALKAIEISESALFRILAGIDDSNRMRIRNEDYDAGALRDPRLRAAHSQFEKAIERGRRLL